MLLHDRNAADALVVGDGLVIGRQQADDLRLANFLERLDTQMSVEQEVLAIRATLARDNRWLDDAQLANGGDDLRVLFGGLELRSDRPQGQNVSDSDPYRAGLERHLHGLLGFLRS